MPSKYHWVIDSSGGHAIAGSPTGETLAEKEAAFTRDIAHRLSLMLNESGIDNTVLVTELQDVGIKQRVARIMNMTTDNVKIIISIRAGLSHDFSGRGEKYGFCVYSVTGVRRGEAVALSLYEELRKAFPEQSLGYEKSYDHKSDRRFDLINRVPYPSAVTVNGYLTNKQDYDLMQTEDYRKAVTLAHFNAILNVENKKAIW